MSLRRFLYFPIILALSLILNTASAAQSSLKDGDTVMLILGSANPSTLKQRVDVALRLYHSDIQFDRIVVSGGCGAHSSSICEASQMDSLLVLNGVPSNKIFKEEKSKTTKQNYCYSKSLKRGKHKLIAPSDHLYVVSSHWHAVPVAACFRAIGVKDTKFHIEGNINPYGPADYTHIYKDCRQPTYCKAILWPRVDASYYNSEKNKIYYFVDNIYYRITPGKGVDAGYPKKLTRYPGFPKSWNKRVDAAWYNPKTHNVYLVQGTHITAISPNGISQKRGTRKLSVFFQNWPKNWGAGYIDAAFYDRTTRKLTLFKNTTFTTVSDNKIDGSPKNITNSYPINLPFQWGSGDLDAAFFDSKTHSITLYRGTDYLKYKLSNGTVASKYPEHTPLPWPKRIWGTKPEMR